MVRFGAKRWTLVHLFYLLYIAPVKDFAVTTAKVTADYFAASKRFDTSAQLITLKNADT